jgi:hypothetical protein
MDGGVDTEERRPEAAQAAQDRTKHVATAHDGGGEENKFQKAIGAWRSSMAGAPPAAES